MEQKIIKMPFDIELAKKITEKSVKGRIVTRDGRNARIACWNYKSLSGEYPLLVLIENGIFEDQELYTLNGKEKSFIKEACDGDLVIEVPEHLESACDNSPILSNSAKIGKEEFKPFDRVLVRQSKSDKWEAMLFSNYTSEIHRYRCMGMNYIFCIPYEGNEHLLGTTDNPEEHE